MAAIFCFLTSKPKTIETCPNCCRSATNPVVAYSWLCSCILLREGQWPSSRTDVSEPGGPGFDSLSWQPQVVAHQHWARQILCSTPSLVLYCAWLVIPMALHVHCGLCQLSPLPTSGDDKWLAAKDCGWAKWRRISDTHRLRWSLQFRYINNHSLVFTCIPQLYSAMQTLHLSH